MTTSRPIRILHVDDEPDLAEVVATFLGRKEDDFAVDTAANAREGMELLATEDFDCVVSDYDMPGQNGIEFLQTVREQYPDLPFILYTGKGSEEVASEAISAGVTDYLQKGTGSSQYTVLANRVQNAVEKHHAQTELADRQQRLTLFFEQSPLGVIEWDQDLRVVRANASATEILGYPEVELVGHSWEMIVPESDRDDVERMFSDLLSDEGGYHGVTDNIRNDGERITCEWHNRIVTDDGEVVSIFSQFQDITERITRQRDLEAQVTAMEAATDGIAILNQDQEYDYMNASHATIYGFDDPDDLVGETWQACYDETELPRFKNEILPVLAEEGEWRGEMRVTTADGRPIDQELTLTRVADGRVVCVVREITDQREQ